MPKNVLLVGQSSQLARACLKLQNANVVIHGVSHKVEWDTLDLQGFDAIINFAYDPLYMREAYDEARDFDLLVAKKAHQAGTHFVMLSTRRVYGQIQAVAPIDEDYPPAPADHYGRNKLRTEKAVQHLLGDRCTVLRVANVFDFEPGRHTFFGIALKNLKLHNRITLDVSPFVRRDFIHIDDFAKTVLQVLAILPAGLFNLGSGTSTEVGKIALWLIQGFGQGELVVISPEERDGFALDRSKLMSALGMLGRPPEIHRHCLQIASRLSEFEFDHE